MGTKSSETSGNQVTMDDFKYLESTMTSQMSELHEMIAQLMQAKAPSAPPPVVVVKQHMPWDGLSRGQTHLGPLYL
jgi:hypothetical protein